MKVMLAKSQMFGHSSPIFQGSIVTGANLITAEKILLLPPYPQEQDASFDQIYRDKTVDVEDLPHWAKDAVEISIESFAALGASNPNRAFVDKVLGSIVDEDKKNVSFAVGRETKFPLKADRVLRNHIAPQWRGKTHSRENPEKDNSSPDETKVRSAKFYQDKEKETDSVADSDD